MIWIDRGNLSEITLRIIEHSKKNDGYLFYCIARVLEFHSPSSF